MNAQPRDRLGSAVQLTRGMFHAMGQMATDTHYCIPRTPATECELDKIRASFSSRQDQPQLSCPSNSSRNIVYFSEKSLISLPAEKPR